jgi:hypothetical protein
MEDKMDKIEQMEEKLEQNGRIDGAEWRGRWSIEKKLEQNGG